MSAAAVELIEAAHIVAGAPKEERQILDFALTSLKGHLLEGFTENPTPMPSAAIFVQKALALLMTAELEADRDESEGSR